MARDPHTDLPGRKLELGLRESNVAMADRAFEQADSLLADAMHALSSVPAPLDVVSALIYAQSKSAAAAAIYTQVQAKMTLEFERAQVSHERAHVEHAEAEVARVAQVVAIRDEGLNAIQERLREAGFDPQVLGGFGIVIPRKDDEEPNT